jgi:hypothetical protein
MTWERVLGGGETISADRGHHLRLLVNVTGHVEDPIGSAGRGA